MQASAGLAFSDFGKRWKTSIVVCPSLGMRRGRYTVALAGEQNVGAKKNFEHAQNFFVGPTFANV